MAKPPRIQRPLAHSLAAQASAVARALEQTDGCTALAQANELRDAVAQAVAANEIPVRLSAKLTAAVEELPGRITCNPAPPPEKPKRDHGKHKGHGGGEG
ncbi:MAG: hypothetical protein ACJ768_25650 [Gaiellaceae bacterium]